MAAKLGNILYWACCVMAGAVVLLTIDSPSIDDFLYGIILALVIWLLGRALRNVLAGISRTH